MLPWGLPPLSTTGRCPLRLNPQTQPGEDKLCENTESDLASAAIDKSMYTSSHSYWFEPLSSSRVGKFRLFCFPHAGGSAQVFHSWRRHFAQEIDLCLVNLPGRAKRIHEKPFTRCNLLVNAIADAMESQMEHRFAFYGHSMGATISFELSREIRRRHQIEPLHLFVSGRRAPQIPNTDPPAFNLPEPEFIDKVHSLNGTPRELLDHPDSRELFLPLLRADFELVDTYEYIPDLPLSCPITSYAGLQDAEVPLDSVAGWANQTSATYRQRQLPGDHFFILHPATNFVDVLRRDVVDAFSQLR